MVSKHIGDDKKREGGELLKKGPMVGTKIKGAHAEPFVNGTKYSGGWTKRKGKLLKKKGMGGKQPNTKGLLKYKLGKGRNLKTKEKDPAVHVEGACVAIVPSKVTVDHPRSQAKRVSGGGEKHKKHISKEVEAGTGKNLHHLETGKKKGN